MLEPRRGGAAGPLEGRCIGLLARRATATLPRARAGHRARHRRHGGALGAHHQPAAARSAPGSRSPTRPARGWPTSSSCSSTPPRCGTTARATASSITEAVRGEGARCSTRRRALRGRARAARPGGAGDPGRAAPQRRARGRPRHARGRHDPLPQHRGRAGGGRASTRARELVPVAPAAHYTMGGVATDLDGRSSAPGPLRGRRVRLHRAPRRQPARVELARRVLRVRPARRARAASTSPQPGAPGGAAGRDPPSLPPRRHARGAMARRRASSATPPGCASCSTTPSRSPA